MKLKKEQLIVGSIVELDGDRYRVYHICNMDLVQLAQGDSKKHKNWISTQSQVEDMESHVFKFEQGDLIRVVYSWAYLKSCDKLDHDNATDYNFKTCYISYTARKVSEKGGS